MSPMHVAVKAGVISVFCPLFFLIGFAEKPQQADKSEKSTEKETTTQE